MDFKLVLQIVGVALGLIYLYLEFKVNPWMWVVGIIMPCTQAVLYFKSGLYADSGMQIYYVGAGIYGLAVWLSGGKKKESGGIARTPGRMWLRLAGCCLLALAGLYFLLSCCTDSTVPFWDALTTALSIVALWMLSRKYLEQWLVWLAVDLISAALYVYKGIPLTAGLYLLYCALAVVGFIKWKSLCEH